MMLDKSILVISVVMVFLSGIMLAFLSRKVRKYSKEKQSSQKQSEFTKPDISTMNLGDVPPPIELNRYSTTSHSGYVKFTEHYAVSNDALKTLCVFDKPFGGIGVASFGYAYLKKRLEPNWSFQPSEQVDGSLYLCVNGFAVMDWLRYLHCHTYDNAASNSEYILGGIGMVLFNLEKEKSSPQLLYELHLARWEQKISGNYKNRKMPFMVRRRIKREAENREQKIVNLEQESSFCLEDFVAIKNIAMREGVKLAALHIRNLNKDRIE